VFYNTLNPGAASDDEATLNQLNAELAALQAQLVSLNITPHGIVKYATRINNLLRDTIPTHMRAVTGRINTVLVQNALASVISPPQQFFAGVPNGADPALGPATPASFYDRTQPAFFGLLGLFGGSSLQMSLVNKIYGPVMAQVSRMMVILAVDALLTDYLNLANMEGITTGGFLSGHANGIPGSTVQGTGMNRENVASNEVFLIGGNAVQQVEGLIDLFQSAGNISSFDELDDFFDSVIDFIGQVQEAYDKAEQPPSSIQAGCVLDAFSNPNCSSLVYNAGFESVSSCSGFFCFDFTVIVLYHNKDTGHWAHGLFSFFD